MKEEKDLFSVGLDEEGAETIRKIYPLAKVLFVVGILLQAFVLYTTVTTYFQYRKLAGSLTSSLSFRLLVTVVYAIVTSVLFFIQSSMFVRFSGNAKLSVDINDSRGFNQSFTWLYRGLLLSVVSMLVHGFYYIATAFLF
jgi:hypothetical protein